MNELHILIIVIIFFQNDYRKLAILINSSIDTTINFMMILAMFVGFFQMRELKFEEGNKSKDKIIIVTAFGMFAYSTFTIIFKEKFQVF